MLSISLRDWDTHQALLLNAEYISCLNASCQASHKATTLPFPFYITSFAKALLKKDIPGLLYDLIKRPWLCWKSLDTKQIKKWICPTCRADQQDFILKLWIPSRIKIIYSFFWWNIHDFTRDKFEIGFPTTKALLRSHNLQKPLLG